MNKYTIPKDNTNNHKQIVARFAHQRSTGLLDLLNDRQYFMIRYSDDYKLV